MLECHLSLPYSHADVLEVVGEAHFRALRSERGLDDVLQRAARDRADALVPRERRNGDKVRCLRVDVSEAKVNLTGEKLVVDLVEHIAMVVAAEQKAEGTGASVRAAVPRHAA